VADELRQALGIEPTLIPDRSGVFDVVVGQKLVFSKFITGRFPDPGELSDKLK